MTKKRSTSGSQPTNNSGQELRLVLGDQLNEQHSWFATISPSVTYVMMEVRSETDYVRHHIQKIIAFFLAMRAFADRLRARGHTVEYLTFDDPRNGHTFSDNIQKLLKAGNFESFAYQEPDEYRVDNLLKELAGDLVNRGLVKSTRMVGSEHFLTSRTELSEHFRGKKTRIMESFYRMMRVKHRVLLDPTDSSKPLGDKWNFDADNRKPFDGKVIPPLPAADRSLASPIRNLEQLLRAAGVKTIGTIDAENFIWPISREAALKALERFIDKRLLHFGEYQDAMTTTQPFMFHSLLSFALNVKLISPREVLDAAIDAFDRSKGKISLAAVEGFVRQILGWREYMRGLYWEQMPSFAEKNFLGATRKLPSYFWTGDTHMKCVASAVNQSLTHAYAHHIQRLMITGNFALLAGINPDEVDQWYLGIYIDAIEWVEITNTRGMSQFADGGIVATKPYCSSANYIKKMSDYCRGCHYDPGERLGERACPFNSLYWDFHLRNRAQLEKNPRIGMVYRTLDKMDGKEIAKIKSKSLTVLNNLESL